VTPSDFAILREAVQNDEGLRLLPYVDTAGKVTIGYGRNLTDVGITKGEALQLLDNDLTNAIASLTRAHPGVQALDPVRQIVLVNVAFNVGIAGINGFVKMWAAVERGDFESAAEELLDSAAARTNPARYARLASELMTGELK
jgi:lysozyme